MHRSGWEVQVLGRSVLEHEQSRHEAQEAQELRRKRLEQGHGMPQVLMVARSQWASSVPGRATAPPSQILASAVKITSGVIGCVVTRAPKGRNASLTAFMTTAGAAPVPDSPTPLAPSRDAEVGVSTCATSMSGISAAIGTR